MAVTSVAAVLAGCSSWSDSCASNEQYQTAQSSAPVSVPQGLESPDPSAELYVPDEPKPAEPLSRNAACLPRPPSYFDKSVKAPGN